MRPAVQFTRDNTHNKTDAILPNAPRQNVARLGGTGCEDQGVEPPFHSCFRRAVSQNVLEPGKMWWRKSPLPGAQKRSRRGEPPKNRSNSSSTTSGSAAVAATAEEAAAVAETLSPLPRVFGVSVRLSLGRALGNLA